MQKNARIFVAGHTGLLGTALMTLPQKEGYSTLLTKTHKELDLTDAQATLAFFRESKPQYVFLVAGKVGGILANVLQPTEFFTENIAIQNNVLFAAKETGVKKLLFHGSACIYPKNAKQPITEYSLLSGELESSNKAYALAKISGITLCQSMRAQYGCNFICAMPTNMYGPNDNFDLQTSHVIPALIRKIHEAKEAKSSFVDIWGNGNATRDFLYVEDCASAFLHLMNKYDSADIINVATGEEVGIRSLAETICDIVGYQGELRFDADKLQGVKRRLLDVQKIHDLGWQHAYSLEEGLRKCYDWYRLQDSTKRKREISTALM